MTPRKVIDPKLQRMIASAQMLDRRRFLRNLGLGVGGSAFLAACGIGENGGSSERPTATGSARPTGPQTVGGELNFANWELYIDVEDENEEVSPTLEQFEEEFGVHVNYTIDINSNEEWFAEIQERLSRGRGIDRDLMVMTDWMSARLIRLEWLERFDHANIPNRTNVIDRLAAPAHDPDRNFTMPWQSGLTGIGYNRALFGRELESMADFFSEDLAGKVTLFTEMRDTMGLVMASMDIDPADHTFEDYERAIERLREAVNSGHVRQFTGNDYTVDLAAGNTVAAIAWSGDVIQLQFEDEDLQFVVPAEGALLWSDEIQIPLGAANKRNAEALIDFVYRPEVAAQIAGWVNYITPVKGAQEAMADVDESLVENELIFPPDEMLSRTFEFKALTEEEDREYQDLFQEVIGV